MYPQNLIEFAVQGVLRCPSVKINLQRLSTCVLQQLLRLADKHQHTALRDIYCEMKTAT